jgi:SSS family solute:Na+ symporter
VLVYVLKGGLTSAMYTEVLQFFMIVLGFAPVVWLGLKDVGGWNALKDILHGVSQDPTKLGLNTSHNFGPDAWTSAWKPIIAGPAANPMGVNVFAVVFGLGFVLSFGYWCTNFLVVQRAMAAKDMGAARRTPLIAAVPKMLFPALVILPGMIAVGLASLGKDGYRLPPVTISSSAYPAAIAAVKEASSQPERSEPAAVSAVIAAAMHQNVNTDKIAALVKDEAATPLSDDDIKTRLQDAVSDTNYNGVILSLVQKYCPPGLMGLALTGLLASFMSGMAGNVTAFNTVWTYDIYQAYINPGKPDQHYLKMGSWVTVVGILLSIICAYFAKSFDNAMDAIQLIFSFINAPVFATFLLGMFWARATSVGAFVGLLCGTLTSALFHLCTIATGNQVGFVKGALFGTAWTFPSDMAKNFWMATFAFLSCFLITIVISLATSRTKSDEELKGLVYSLTEKVREPDQAWYATPAFLGTVLLLACVALNIYFW